MRGLAAEAQGLEAQLDVCTDEYQALRDEISGLKVLEEAQRRQMAVAFEAHCAGLHRRADQPLDEEDGAYSRALARTMTKARAK